jgi:NTE family protein
LLGIVGAALAGCASRPINPPIDKVDTVGSYRYSTRQDPARAPDTLLILAFSGGGTRAAAFSFGVLEALRDTAFTGPTGKQARLLDEVDVITGVSGGSFTALAYGLYGDRLFAEYEQRFLKRNIQGELIVRFFAPRNWSSLWSSGWGRSEMAAELYDEVLFQGATFGDLHKKPGPLIIATATDISTGSRLGFVQSDFDLICSDLSAVPLSRAAASSSAVPLVLSPVTFNNYGGTCGYRLPAWARAVADPENRSRPAGRALQRYKEMVEFEDGANRPFLHLVDGGVSDNLGMRAVLEALEELEIAKSLNRKTRLDNVRRIVVIVVNSLSVPRTDWDRKEDPPNDVQILIKAAGVPIDRYSYEAVELLKDMIARWHTLRQVKSAGAFANAGNPALARAADVPDIDLYAIDVSFQAHPNAAERAFLNEQPTSFVLSDEAVDRLRRAAGTILLASPDFQRLLKDTGVTLTKPGGPAAPAIPVAPPAK